MWSVAASAGRPRPYITGHRVVLSKNAHPVYIYIYIIHPVVNIIGATLGGPAPPYSCPPGRGSAIGKSGRGFGFDAGLRAFSRARARARCGKTTAAAAAVVRGHCLHSRTSCTFAACQLSALTSVFSSKIK